MTTTEFAGHGSRGGQGNGGIADGYGADGRKRVGRFVLGGDGRVIVSSNAKRRARGLKGASTEAEDADVVQSAG